VQIGIPDDDAFEGDKPTPPGWKIALADYFTHPGAVARYEYDFGDGWDGVDFYVSTRGGLRRQDLTRCQGRTDMPVEQPRSPIS
jgi:hypothetical protein